MKKINRRIPGLLLSCMLLFNCLAFTGYAEEEEPAQEGQNAAEEQIAETPAEAEPEIPVEIAEVTESEPEQTQEDAPEEAAEAAAEEETEEAEEELSDEITEELTEDEQDEMQEAADEEQNAELTEAEEELAEAEEQLAEEATEEALPEEAPAENTALAEETEETGTMPEEEPEEEQEEAETELPVSWTLEYPENLSVSYKESVMALNTAKAVNIQNLGDSTIYLTVTCNCVFMGNSDTMPVTLCVGGVPVTPGEAAVYGTVTAAGADYAAVTLVFTEEGWAALASGRYSMTISYTSYIG